MSRQAGVVSRAVAAVALAGAACVVGAAPASGHSREVITIATSGNILGPTTASGTFTSKVGRFEDSGTYTETYTLVGDEINAEKVLTGRRGTITIRLRGYRVMQTPTTATFRDGWWRVIAATRAYSGLRGGGRPAVASGGADFATRTVNVVHAGKVRHGRGHHHHGHHSR